MAAAPEGAAAIGDKQEALGKAGEEETGNPAALVPDIPPADGAAPVGPSTEEEAVFLAGDRLSEQAYGAGPKVEGGEPESEQLETPLPPMEDLVKRIPAPVRELMEELLRARFVTVKRVPKAALKSG
jgi:hypothetical protein